jgi:hypothetical protein
MRMNRYKWPPPKNSGGITRYSVLVACHKAQKLYRIEFMQLPGLPFTVAVFRDLTKEIPL